MLRNLRLASLTHWLATFAGVTARIATHGSLKPRRTRRARLNASLSGLNACLASIHARHARLRSFNARRARRASVMRGL